MDLKTWAKESFGVYHANALLDVRPRFAKDVAERAAKVTFHPSWKTEKGRQGSLVVTQSERTPRAISRTLSS